MKRTVVLIVLFCAPLFAFGAENKPSVYWKAGISGRSTDDSLSSSKTVALGTSLKAEYKPSPIYWFDLRTNIILETGSSSSLFTEEFRPRSGLTLEHATVTLNPWSPLRFTLGAIDQAHHSSPLLVASSTFPAVQEILSWKNESWQLHLDAQQAIPTGTRLSQKTIGKEATPSLLTEKIVLEHRTVGSHFLRGRATHFQFHNLTRGIAQDSRFYGNTVTGVAAASQFVYAYRGFEFGLEGGVNLSKNIALNLGSSFLNNNGAPKTRNQGRYLFAEAAWKNASLELAPRIEHYYNEADASPAYYSSAVFGHNNRKGPGAAFRVSLLKEKLDITARWAKTKLIEPYTFQRNNFTYAEIVVETPYASF